MGDPLLAGGTQAFQHIVVTVAEILPDDWHTVWLYAEVMEGTGLIRCFVDTADPADGPMPRQVRFEPVRMFEVMESFRDVWYLAREQDPDRAWTTATLTMRHDGQFRVEYGYEPIPFEGESARLETWAQTYLPALPGPTLVVVSADNPSRSPDVPVADRQPPAANDESLTDLYVQHICAAMDKQYAFLDVIGDRRYNWNVSPREGVLDLDVEVKRRFGRPSVERLSYRAYPLGSEAYGLDTWLWSWVNEASALPDEVLVAGRALQSYGREHDIAALVEPELPLSAAVNGDRFAAIASGLLDADFYFRCPYAGGILFVVVNDPAFRRGVVDPLMRIAFTFTKLTMDDAVDLPDPRAALVAYLHSYNLTVTVDGARVSGTTADGRILTADFDERGRFAGLHGTFTSDRKKQ